MGQLCPGVHSMGAASVAPPDLRTASLGMGRGAASRAHLGGCLKLVWARVLGLTEVGVQTLLSPSINVGVGAGRM